MTAVLPEGLEIKTAALADPMMGRASGSGGGPAVRPPAPVEGETGIVEFYAAVTGVQDEVKDTITPGAFRRTLAKRRPKVCLGHDWNRPIGRVIEVKELMPGDPALPSTTSTGQPWPRAAGALWVRAQYNLATKDGYDAYQMAKFYGPEESLYSIGYVVTGADDRRQMAAGRVVGGNRDIHDVDLYEFGPVLHPAHPLANLAGTKSARVEVMETKARYVRDSEFWGMPIGTPITPGMKPRGKVARAMRRDGKRPPENGGTMDYKPDAAQAHEIERELPKSTRARARAISAENDEAGLFAEPAAERVTATNRGKDRSDEHLDTLSDQARDYGEAEGAFSSEAAPGALVGNLSAEQRAAMGGLLDEGLSPDEVDQALPTDIDPEHRADILDEYRSQYSARVSMQRQGAAPADGSTPPRSPATADGGNVGPGAPTAGPDENVGGSAPVPGQPDLATPRQMGPIGGTPGTNPVIEADRQRRERARMAQEAPAAKTTAQVNGRTAQFSDSPEGHATALGAMNRREAMNHAASLDDDTLRGANAELDRRAALMGRGDQPSKAHAAVRAELAQRDANRPTGAPEGVPGGPAAVGAPDVPGAPADEIDRRRASGGNEFWQPPTPTLPRRDTPREPIGMDPAEHQRERAALAKYGPDYLRALVEGGDGPLAESMTISAEHDAQDAVNGADKIKRTNRAKRYRRTLDEAAAAERERQAQATADEQATSTARAGDVSTFLGESQPGNDLIESSRLAYATEGDRATLRPGSFGDESWNPDGGAIQHATLARGINQGDYSIDDAREVRDADAENEYGVTPNGAIGRYVTNPETGGRMRVSNLGGTGSGMINVRGVDDDEQAVEFDMDPRQRLALAGEPDASAPIRANRPGASSRDGGGRLGTADGATGVAPSSPRTNSRAGSVAPSPERTPTRPGTIKRDDMDSARSDAEYAMRDGETDRLAEALERMGFNGNPEDEADRIMSLSAAQRRKTITALATLNTEAPATRKAREERERLAALSPSQRVYESGRSRAARATYAQGLSDDDLAAAIEANRAEDRALSASGKRRTMGGQQQAKRIEAVSEVLTAERLGRDERANPKPPREPQPLTERNVLQYALDGQNMSTDEIAAEFGTSQQHALRIMRKLERDGYVTREDDSDGFSRGGVSGGRSNLRSLIWTPADGLDGDDEATMARYDADRGEAGNEPIARRIANEMGRGDREMGTEPPPPGMGPGRGRIRPTSEDPDERDLINYGGEEGESNGPAIPPDPDAVPDDAADAEALDGGQDPAADDTPMVELPAAEVDDAFDENDRTERDADAAVGLEEDPDGEEQISEADYERQNRVGLLVRQAGSGRLNLARQSDEQLGTTRRDLVDELALQNRLQARKPYTPQPRTPRDPDAAPKRKPGVAGAAEALADARGTEGAAEALRDLRSSLNRSRSDDEAVVALRERVNAGETPSNAELRDAAKAMRAQARVKRNDAAKRRRKARRIERDRIRSTIGQVDAEMRNRGMRPEDHGGNPDAPETPSTPDAPSGLDPTRQVPGDGEEDYRTLTGQARRDAYERFRARRRADQQPDIERTERAQALARQARETAEGGDPDEAQRLLDQAGETLPGDPTLGDFAEQSRRPAADAIRIERERQRRERDTVPDGDSGLMHDPRRGYFMGDDEPRYLTADTPEGRRNEYRAVQAIRAGNSNSPIITEASDDELAQLITDLSRPRPGDLENDQQSRTFMLRAARAEQQRRRDAAPAAPERDPGFADAAEVTGTRRDGSARAERAQVPGTSIYVKISSPEPGQEGHPVRGQWQVSASGLTGRDRAILETHTHSERFGDEQTARDQAARMFAEMREESTRRDAQRNGGDAPAAPEVTPVGDGGDNPPGFGEEMGPADLARARASAARRTRATERQRRQDDQRTMAALGDRASAGRGEPTERARAAAAALPDEELDRFGRMAEGRNPAVRNTIRDEWSRRLGADRDGLHMSTEAQDARTRLLHEQRVIEGRLDRDRNGRGSPSARERDRERLREIETERRSWNDQGRRSAWLAANEETPDRRPPGERAADDAVGQGVEAVMPNADQQVADNEAAGGYNMAAARRSILRGYLDPRADQVDTSLSMSRSNMGDAQWARALVLGRAPLEGTGQRKRRRFDDEAVSAELGRVESGDETHPAIAHINGRRVSFGDDAVDQYGHPFPMRDAEITSVTRGPDGSLVVGAKYRTPNELGEGRRDIEKHQVVRFKPGTTPTVQPLDDTVPERNRDTLDDPDAPQPIDLDAMRADTGAEPAPDPDPVDLDAMRADTGDGGEDYAPDSDFEDGPALPEPPPGMTAVRRAEIEQAIDDHGPTYGRPGAPGGGTHAEAARYLSEGHLNATREEWDWLNDYLRAQPERLDRQPLTTEELRARREQRTETAKGLAREARAAHDGGDRVGRDQLLDQAAQADPASSERIERMRAQYRAADGNVPDPQADAPAEPERREAPYTPEQAQRGRRMAAIVRRVEAGNGSEQDGYDYEEYMQGRGGARRDRRDARAEREEMRRIAAELPDMDEQQAARYQAENDLNADDMRRLNAARREQGLSHLGRQSATSRRLDDGRTVERTVSDARSGKARNEVLAGLDDRDLEDIAGSNERYLRDVNHDPDRQPSFNDRRQWQQNEKRRKVARDVRAEQDRRGTRPAPEPEPVEDEQAPPGLEVPSGVGSAARALGHDYDPTLGEVNVDSHPEGVRGMLREAEVRADDPDLSDRERTAASRYADALRAEADRRDREGGGQAEPEPGMVDISPEEVDEAGRAADAPATVAPMTSTSAPAAPTKVRPTATAMPRRTDLERADERADEELGSFLRTRSDGELDALSASSRERLQSADATGRGAVQRRHNTLVDAIDEERNRRDPAYGGLGARFGRRDGGSDQPQRGTASARGLSEGDRVAFHGTGRTPTDEPVLATVGRDERGRTVLRDDRGNVVAPRADDVDMWTRPARDDEAAPAVRPVGEMSDADLDREFREVTDARRTSGRSSALDARYDELRTERSRREDEADRNAVPDAPAAPKALADMTDGELAAERRAADDRSLRARETNARYRGEPTPHRDRSDAVRAEQERRRANVPADDIERSQPAPVGDQRNADDIIAEASTYRPTAAARRRASRDAAIRTFTPDDPAEIAEMSDDELREYADELGSGALDEARGGAGPGTRAFDHQIERLRGVEGEQQRRRERAEPETPAVPKALGEMTDEELAAERTRRSDAFSTAAVANGINSPEARAAIADAEEAATEAKRRRDAAREGARPAAQARVQVGRGEANYLSSLITGNGDAEADGRVRDGHLELTNPEGMRSRIQADIAGMRDALDEGEGSASDRAKSRRRIEQAEAVLAKLDAPAGQSQPAPSRRRRGASTDSPTAQLRAEADAQGRSPMDSAAPPVDRKRRTPISDAAYGGVDVMFEGGGGYIDDSPETQQKIRELGGYSSGGSVHVTDKRAALATIDNHLEMIDSNLNPPGGYGGATGEDRKRYQREQRAVKALRDKVAAMPDDGGDGRGRG